MRMILILICLLCFIGVHSAPSPAPAAQSLAPSPTDPAGASTHTLWQAHKMQMIMIVVCLLCFIGGQASQAAPADSSPTDPAPADSAPADSAPADPAPAYQDATSRMSDVDWNFNSADILDEIVCEILVRSDLKTLAVCMAVSKSWLNIISQTSFNEKIRNRPDTLIIPEYKNDKKLLKCCRNRDVSDEFSEINIPEHFDSTTLIGSCRGVLCLFNGINVILWNPLTQENLIISLPPQVGRKPVIGFTFAENQFKLYCLQPLSEPSHTIMQTYFFNQNIWSPEIFLVRCPIISHCSFLIKDTLYFCQYNFFDECHSVCSINPLSNKVSTFSCSTIAPSRMPHIVNMRDRVTAVIHTRPLMKSELRIYQLSEEDQQWESMYVIAPFPVQYEILSRVRTFGRTRDLVLVGDVSAVTIYSLEERRVLPNVDLGSAGLLFGESFRHQPSLTSIVNIRIARAEGHTWISKLLSDKSEEGEKVALQKPDEDE